MTKCLNKNTVIGCLYTNRDLLLTVCWIVQALYGTGISLLCRNRGVTPATFIGLSACLVNKAIPQDVPHHKGVAHLPNS